MRFFLAFVASLVGLSVLAQPTNIHLTSVASPFVMNATNAATATDGQVLIKSGDRIKFTDPNISSSSNLLLNAYGPTATNISSVYDNTEAYISGLGTINDGIRDVDASSANGHYYSYRVEPRILTNANGVYLYSDVSEGLWVIHTNLDYLTGNLNTPVWVFTQIETDPVFPSTGLGTNGVKVFTTTGWSDGAGNSLPDNTGQFKTNSFPVYTTSPLVTSSTLATESNANWSLTFNSWPHFYPISAVNHIKTPCNFSVVVAGDGLIATGNRAAHVFWGLTNTWNSAGFLSVYFPYWSTTVTNGLWITQPNMPDTGGPWMNDFYVLTNGGSAVIFSGYSGLAANPTANVGGVYYLAKSGSGTFVVKTNFNNGTWTTVSGLSAVDASVGTGARVLLWTNATAGPMAILVSNTTANAVTILGAKAINTLSNGFLFGAYAGSSSASMNQMTGTNITSIVAPIFRDWNADILISEKIGMRDYFAGQADSTGSPTFTNSAAWFSMLSTNNPSTDVVIAGHYPMYNNADCVLDNYMLKTNAQFYGFGYFDSYNAMGGSISNALTKGYTSTSDGTHATAAGFLAQDLMLWKWVDLKNF